MTLKLVGDQGKMQARGRLLQKAKNNYHRIREIDFQLEWDGDAGIYAYWTRDPRAFDKLKPPIRETKLLLEKLAPPGHELHPWFRRIVDEALSLEFHPDMQERWVLELGPLVHAFLHCKYVMHQLTIHSIIQTGEGESGEAQDGWGLILELFQLR